MHGGAAPALLAGVKLPTGDDGGALVERREAQPSSQPAPEPSTSGGRRFSRTDQPVTLDASMTLQRGEHDDFTVGDRFDASRARVPFDAKT
jgi:hypothetical protein